MERSEKMKTKKRGSRGREFHNREPKSIFKRNHSCWPADNLWWVAPWFLKVIDYSPVSLGSHIQYWSVLKWAFGWIDPAWDNDPLAHSERLRLIFGSSPTISARVSDKLRILRTVGTRMWRIHSQVILHLRMLISCHGKATVVQMAFASFSWLKTFKSWQVPQNKKTYSDIGFCIRNGTFWHKQKCAELDFWRCNLTLI